MQHRRAGTLVIVVRAAGSTNTYPRHLNHVIKLKPSEHSKTESLMLSFYFHLFCMLVSVVVRKPASLIIKKKKKNKKSGGGGGAGWGGGERENCIP